MKKALLVLALGVLAMFSFASAASATITSHSNGDAVTANGTISLRGSIINTTCSISLGGAVVNVNSTVRVDSGSGSCNTGRLTLSGFSWTKTFTLAGTWTLSGLRATVAVPLVGNCIYSGSLGGTWTSDGFDTILTIVNASTSLTLDGSSASLCTRSPVVTGTVTLLGVATA